MKNIELKEALEDGHLYDFISNKGYDLSKDELISIIKELSFAVYSEKKDDKEYIKFEKRVLENLKENSFLFEE